MRHIVAVSAGNLRDAGLTWRPGLVFSERTIERAMPVLSNKLSCVAEEGLYITGTVLLRLTEGDGEAKFE
jgi:hypothetical protein